MATASPPASSSRGKSVILPAYGAQISQTELRNFDQFLDSHPQIRAELISACHAPEP